MKVYRGLNLNDSDIKYIKENGDWDREKGAWLLKPTISHHDLNVNEVFDIISNEPDDIVRYNRDSNDILDIGKYVTGCFLGASIYSNDSEKKERNIVIELEVDLNNIFIDGRDFLYSAIPMFIENQDRYFKVSHYMTDVYGEKFDDYLRESKVLKGSTANKIFRFIDYLCMDESIVKAHAENNSTLIEGRYYTKFFSAFGIIGGIKPEMIVKTRTADSIKRKTPISFLQSAYEFENKIGLSDCR